MRRASVVLVLLFLAAAPQVRAQNAAADERAIRRLEEDWTRGVVRRDGALFRRLLDPRFVYTEDAVVMNGEELTKAVVAGPDTVTRATNEEMRVLMHGNVGIVIGVLRLVGHSKGKPFDRRFRFTDTWVKKNGAWRIVAAQDYLLPR
jgi:ketosteroid isomerase-like protein